MQLEDEGLSASCFIPKAEAPVGVVGVGEESVAINARPEVRGKFLFVNGHKFFIRGVTYGPFRPDSQGNEYNSPIVVNRDFALMAVHRINAVRTYTVPPRWFLDCAQKHGLKVMVGVAWEQHISFLSSRRQRATIVKKVREGVRSCAGHPAVLCYAVGNEIPANSVRWYGRHQVEKFLEKLYRAAKSEDPEGLVTYVNYPTTEYLQLPFIDLVCFNVYLEQKKDFEAYLGRLQNIAGNRPLIMAEIGLDSLRNGEQTQSKMLEWQIRSTFAYGAGGLFVFSWTDEWHRGNQDVTDWAFGVTDLTRRPKPALETVSTVFADLPLPQTLQWPKISVVVCTYNGSRTLRDCLTGVSQLVYPDFEVIVINDGSTDKTESIAQEYEVRLISTKNQGLSAARNEGMRAAQGEIVAYLDDDAWPDPHWLTYLATTFMHSKHAAVGGPNIAPDDDGPVAYCVAHAPGGPTHVLLTDHEAEHLPGCNMAVRKGALENIGGFDPIFRVAGDDVDVCWKLQQKGGSLGFSPGAMVWHRRRATIRAFWKQQFHYGKAEALLELKWPEKYNAMGHLTWRGRLYHSGAYRPLPFQRWRVYHGVWGTELFQSIYAPAAGRFSAILQMPECYLLAVALTGFSAVGALWKPLLFAAPLALLVIVALLAQAMVTAMHTPLPQKMGTGIRRVKWRMILAWLNMMQPMARLGGRLRYGLTPWRKRGGCGMALPKPRKVAIWCEQWRSLEDRLRGLEESLYQKRTVVRRGDVYQRWDLQVSGGLLAGVRLRTMIEEHALGRQYVRFSIWPTFSGLGVVTILALAVLAMLASMQQSLVASIILGTPGILMGVRMLLEASWAAAAVRESLSTSQPSPDSAACPKEVAIISDSAPRVMPVLNNSTSM